MKDRYNASIEQAESAKTSAEQRRCMLQIIKTMATNHLPTIEAKLNKLIWLGVILLIAVLFSSKDSIEWIWLFFTRLF